MTQIRSEISACTKLCNDYRVTLYKTAPKHLLLTYRVNQAAPREWRTFFDTFGPENMQNLNNPTPEQMLSALKGYYAALQAAVAIEKARDWGKLS